MEICVIEPGGTVAPFLRLVGEAAAGLPERGNELAGVVFEPVRRSAVLRAQRAYGLGVVYEVTGPFTERRRRCRRRPPPARLVGSLRGLRVRAPRRISLAAVRRSGLPVEVARRLAAALRVALRTDDLRRVPGAAGRPSGRGPSRSTAAGCARRRPSGSACA